MAILPSRSATSRCPSGINSLQLPSVPRLPGVARARYLASRLYRKLNAKPLPVQQLLFVYTQDYGAQWDDYKKLYHHQALLRVNIENYSRLLEEQIGCTTCALFSEEVSPQEQPSSAGLARRNELLRLGLTQIGLTDLWLASGIRPTGVLAAGVGEVAAGYASGMLSREDAIKVMCWLATELSNSELLSAYFVIESDLQTAKNICRAAPARLKLCGVISANTCLIACPMADADINRAHILQATHVKKEFQAYGSSHQSSSLSRDISLRKINHPLPELPFYAAGCGDLVSEEMLQENAYWNWVSTGDFDLDGAARSAFADGFNLVINLNFGNLMGEGIQETAHRSGSSIRFLDCFKNGQLQLEACLSAVKKGRGHCVVNSKRHVRACSTVETFNLADPVMIANPFPCFEDLRREGPVHFLPQNNCWLVIGYAEVQAALAQPEIFSNRAPEWLTVDPVLLGADPPEHTVARRLLGSHFSAQVLAEHGIFAEKAARQLLEPLLQGQQIEVLRDFTTPLAEAVAAHLIGFDAPAFESIKCSAGSANNLEEMLTGIDLIIANVANELPLYRQLLQNGGGAITSQEARSLIRLLWIAGITTTRRALASAILMLLRYTELKLQIESDPALLPGFVEESIRLHPPELVIARVTRADVKLGSSQIPAGAQVKLCLAAANRDPAQFHEPQTLMMHRTPNRHLSFSGGIHRCLGAAIARTEMISALRVLLHEAPNFRSVKPLPLLGYTGFSCDTLELVIEC